jgi:hypothetical protein
MAIIKTAVSGKSSPAVSHEFNAVLRAAGCPMSWAVFHVVVVVVVVVGIIIIVVGLTTLLSMYLLGNLHISQTNGRITVSQGKEIQPIP